MTPEIESGDNVLEVFVKTSLREHREHRAVIGQLREDLRALQHHVQGPVSGDIERIRSRLSEHEARLAVFGEWQAKASRSLDRWDGLHDEMVGLRKHAVKLVVGALATGAVSAVLWLLKQWKESGGEG